MEIVISWIASFIIAVSSGMAVFFMQRSFHKQRKREEEREEIKEKDTSLILRSLNALGKLTLANSIALRDGKTNGEMSSALSEYEAIEKEMYTHLVTHYSKKLHD